MTVHFGEVGHKLWPLDLPYTGELFRRVRESRGVSVSALASKVGVDAGRISYFEKGKYQTAEKFPDYVSNLGAMAAPSLTTSQAALLVSFYEHGKRIREHEEAFACISLADTRYRPHPKLRLLIDRLHQTPEPAFIMDSLYFLHAVNGAAMRLFGMTANHPHWKRWEAWHVIACKVYPSSPIAERHVHTDGYFPQTIAQYFEHEFARPYWFSYQARETIHKVQQIATPAWRFDMWWNAATCLNHGYNLDTLKRLMWFEFADGQRRQIIADAVPETVEQVEVSPGCEVGFVLATWRAQGSDGELAFEEIQAHPNARHVYFADEFDRRKRFHANDWPEVREMLGL